MDFIKEISYNKQEKETPRSLKEVEEELIDKTMKFYDGNISKVSKSLGMTRATLYRRLSELEQKEME